MQTRMVFMVLEIWPVGFGLVLEIFLKEFVQALIAIFSILWGAISKLQPVLRGRYLSQS